MLFHIKDPWKSNIIESMVLPGNVYFSSIPMKTSKRMTPCRDSRQCSLAGDHGGSPQGGDAGVWLVLLAIQSTLW